MYEPIGKLMHNDTQLRIAELQDNIVHIIFDNVDAVMHGGTAIWRCYGGKRFSEDIDLYINKRSYLKKAVSRITMAGLNVKFNRERRGTIYYDVFDRGVTVSLQIKLARKRGRLISFEKVDGTTVEIYSLSPEDIILEKIEAYRDRMLVRDVYDIMILTRHVSGKESIVSALTAFLSSIKRPKDEGVLKELVYSGVIPSFNDIIEYLKNWCNL